MQAARARVGATDHSEYVTKDFPSLRFKPTPRVPSQRLPASSSSVLRTEVFHEAVRCREVRERASVVAEHAIARGSEPQVASAVHKLATDTACVRAEHSPQLEVLDRSSHERAAGPRLHTVRKDWLRRTGQRTREQRAR
jgi:hypothetical protein